MCVSLAVLSRRASLLNQGPGKTFHTCHTQSSVCVRQLIPQAPFRRSSAPLQGQPDLVSSVLRGQSGLMASGGEANSSRSGNMQSCAASTSRAEAQVAPRTAKGGLSYTSHEGNSWQATFTKTGLTVLVDPWLVDKMTFLDGKLKWLYAGNKNNLDLADIDADAIAAASDFILLSQSLDDHAHRPTLRALPKELPVVANPGAAQIARDLGFKTVHELDHGQSMTMGDGRLRITATVGALTGPPWSKRQNGYVLEEQDGIRLYYEPHFDHNIEDIKGIGHVDVVVGPAITVSLLGLYPLVKGDSEVVELLRMLQPSAVIPLLNADLEGAVGPLKPLLSQAGTVDGLEEKLQNAGIYVSVNTPSPPGRAITVEV